MRHRFATAFIMLCHIPQRDKSLSHNQANTADTKSRTVD